MGDKTSRLRFSPAAVPGSCKNSCATPMGSSPLGPDSWAAKIEHPTEENNGGHAEVVEVVFDSERLSYRGLLEVFFQVHRPDLDEGVVGTLYRSEIFYTSLEQRAVAEEMIRDVDASRHWLGKTVTKISEAGQFWVMGPEDQDYLMRFPRDCKCSGDMNDHLVELSGQVHWLARRQGGLRV